MSAVNDALSKVNDLTLEICVPRLRCIPEHSIKKIDKNLLEETIYIYVFYLCKEECQDLKSTNPGFWLSNQHTLYWTHLFLTE